VVPAERLDAELAAIVEKAFHASRTATGHAKRLLHESFHADPRAMIEAVIRAQNDCLTSWEIREANRAWDETPEARFYPPAGAGGPQGHRLIALASPHRLSSSRTISGASRSETTWRAT